ncbi:hypothetical protein H072_11296 [Dactylellina haptotyla CBS 200.50]|uniref:Uncharacterized protein n=1 Tax=Dactylellina haptotyla (strain CBS 200.50) TaxID=1284197 RepID=S7ZY60_DACHA|nr:hypothetical protein H072_11296 [Dactylellina haptotyla CBS 200.50]
MSASAVPIPLEQFAQALLELEIAQLHLESSRLQNSLYHLERSNATLEEYPDDEDCKDAIRYNQGVIDQQKQRIELIRLELGRRGISVEHMEIDNPRPPASTSAATLGEGQAASGEIPGGQSSTSPSNGTAATNGDAGDDEGVYL